LESKGVKTYNEAIALCIKHKDAGSRDLMERMVVESEGSIDWAEAQRDLIRLMGLENYLAQQIGEGEGH
jgi:bacterioferritin